MSEATRTTYGPYRAFERGVNGIPKEMISFPYDKVKGSNLVVTLTDNYSVIFPNLLDDAAWATAEVSIDGAIEGYYMRLKTQQIRMITGPMKLFIPFDLPYGAIRILARNTTGGVEANNFSASLAAMVVFDINVYIQPHNGFNLPKNGH